MAMLMVACLAAFTACSGGSETPADNGGDTKTEESGAAESKGKVETAGNITVLVPDGWTLQPGTAGDSSDENSCFVMMGSSMSDGYVWVTISDESTAANSIAGHKTDEVEPFTVNGIEWSGKDGCFSGTIGDDLYLIMLYGLTHDDANVQAILSSLND